MKMEVLDRANAIVREIADLAAHKKEVVLRLEDTRDKESRLVVSLNPSNWSSFVLESRFLPMTPHMMGRVYVAAIDARISVLEAEFVALKSE